ncbi:hypothetical protein W02_26520 [Nitrospira sp. KM1]|uniref:hypothetical protein n=1 Tax=Nitrospira sp. KM1 TaxID=1936990 RepID=UPI0013A79160|nr:hypothetical protein [Nitrospira sp. KM1]BCA55512.1 hypothetical protein W02_26520 [Nitrospira sp. KM1]
MNSLLPTWAQSGTTILFTSWILWVESGSLLDLVNKQTRWSIYEAYESREECKRDMKGLINSIKTSAIDRGEKVSDSERNALVFEKRGVSRSAHYYCLPADLDPRPRN